MGDNSQIVRIENYAKMIRAQMGKAVRPYRADGYINMLNKYGTSRDASEQYQFTREPYVPDIQISSFYEGNGLFAKIIDTPAEESVKHGFTLKDLADEDVESFYIEALDELDWEEIAMTAVKWTRLFGGAIAVMLINDGKGLEEPVDWENIKSIDDIVVFDRAIVEPNYASMYNYDPRNPFGTRSARLGMPDRYFVTSKRGSFTVHESRCLVFQNGKLPENSTNEVYQFWGVPEYVRINRAIRDAEVAHGSAVKLLDRSIQPVYKMSNLSQELATEGGEDRVLKRLETIDMARGMLNTITIDNDGEDYDFKSFTYSGVSDVVDCACNYLSALTSIPQTILFGRSPAGMNATGASDLENYYNYVERIQKKMLKSNLRYLLSVIFKAGEHTGEIEKTPSIKIEFNPLWSLNETEQASLDQTKAATQLTRAQTAAAYIEMQALDPTEVRKRLAQENEFDVEDILNNVSDEDLFKNMPQGQPEGQEGKPGGQMPGGMPPMAQKPAEAQKVPAQNTMPKNEKKEEGNEAEGSTPTNAPAATKLPQDMTTAEKVESKEEGKKEPERKAEEREKPKTDKVDELRKYILSFAKEV